MSALTLAAIRFAAGGMLLALAELMLPRSAIRNTARAAFGLLFLELLTEQIVGIIP
jgi:hypothetical protein